MSIKKCCLALTLMLAANQETAEASEIPTADITYDEAIQSSVYNPAESCEIPYKDAVIEEGPEGENPDEVVVGTEPASMDQKGAGEWDIVGAAYFNHMSPVFKSYGGDFKITHDGYSNYSFDTFTIMEDDGSSSSNPDDEVITFTISSYNSKVLYDIGKWCDGDNGTAEFYIIKDHTNDTIHVTAYD